MKKIPKFLVASIFLAGLAWANETDAEIVKDLDFFMNFEVVREETVMADDGWDENELPEETE